MSEINRVKIQDFIQSQIPEFLNEESPLFNEFLKQYYISQEHQTGVSDLATNIQKYKSIDNFNNETFYTDTNPCILTSEIFAFDSTIEVNHTIGFPRKYGLLKIDNEIITYMGKTATSFTGCVRGFSGIDSLEKNLNSQQLNFSTTSAEGHLENSIVQNLNVIFFDKFFTKFKAQFLPGFESRDFFEKVDIKNILRIARDFYSTKGTDTAFKILFEVLFGKQISVIKPQDFLIRPSDNTYILTKNILVEKVSGGDPLDLIGKTLFQEIESSVIASASIYNVEYRPTEDKDLYEISLDIESFVSDFETTSKTRVLENIVANSDYVTVDSTIGFPQSGNLVLNSSSLTNNVTLTYTDKTINQFLGVSGLLFNINIDDEIFENKFAYSFLDDESTITFRVINVISDLDYSTTSNLRVGDKIALSSFGIDLNFKPEFRSWIYNIPTSHRIKSISLSGDSNGNIWNLELFDSIKFYVGEEVELSNPDDINDIPVNTVIRDIITEKVVEVETSEDVSLKTFVNKKLKKAESNQNYFENASKLFAGIQNTYIDFSEENIYVASSGLPNYKIFSKDRTINVTTSVGIGTTTILDTSETHKFYTGEQIYYFSSANSGIKTGIYHVTAIGDVKDSKQISLSYNKSDVFTKKYVPINLGISSDYFVRIDYENKELEHQKIFKKINLTKNAQILTSNENRTTNNRQVGLLINGVEIYSPTLYDENIYYGKIDSVQITNRGKDYDVINYPTIDIIDENGYGADVHVNIVGELKDIKIVSPGIGYEVKPKISIVGGNGSGAVVEPNLVRTRIISGFRGDGIGVDPTTITFVENHNFDNGEEVIYDSNGNSDIFPLKDKSSYFVGIVNSKTINLYNTYSDAINQQNNINFVGISSGFHRFKTLNSKNTITKIYVRSSGSGYSNKKVKVPSLLSYDNKTNGVNTFDDYIFAKNHNFKTKDVLLYSRTGTAISGLSTTTSYLVTVLDSNKFKLSEAGIGTNFNEDNYKNKKYVKLSSVGSGIHEFSYPPIEINVESLSGISSSSIVTPILEPLILGSVDSVFINEGGVGYGVSNIINFHRRPNIGISSITSEALLRPIILNGSIVDVQILNYGNGYDKGIDIVVDGDGDFAEIIPIIENGRISGVNIANGGIGYKQSNTNLIVSRRGTDARFIANVFEWKVNEVEKNSFLLDTDDEGIIVPSKNTEFGLQFVNFYSPKLLRRQIKDHIDNANREVLTENHSPIIGWAYDGNPIYGPYGQVNSEFRRIRTSYIKDVLRDPLLRPDFPEGFFIQDYRFDEAIGDLDEYNGRYCVTPEYPNGTYAYFCTIDDKLSSKPEYPYIISTSFKNNPIPENYDSRFIQDEKTESFDLIRNTGPYFIDSENSSYKLIKKIKPNYKQEFSIQKIKSSGIDAIEIYDPGLNYEVNDPVIFDKTFSGGSGASALVSRIRGKDLLSMQIGVSTFSSVDFENNGNVFYANTKQQHNLLTGEKVVISGISTSEFSYIEGEREIFVPQKTVGLTSSIPNLATTGVSTFISVNDITGFEINDLIKIDNELLRITKISEEESKFHVNRISNTGVHTVGLSSVFLVPTKFIFNVINSTKNIVKNKVLYFDSKSLVGFGTTGSNYTLFSNENLYVPEKAIYIKNHKLYTGQELTYNVGVGGTGLLVSNNLVATAFNLIDGQKVYAVNYGNDFVGLSTLGFTTSAGIGTLSRSLYFYDNASVTGYSHSITTLNKKVYGQVENYNLVSVTKEPHELETYDKIKFNIIPSLVESVSLKYDVVLRKIVTKLVDFDSSTEVYTSTSEIGLLNHKLKTGDKVVYYNNENTNVGGIQNNKTYFVIKNDSNKIKLATSYYDSLIGNAISITSASTGTHSFAMINPPLTFTKGNLIEFDLSDKSLIGMDLKLYKDENFINEIESFNYKRNFIESGIDGAKLTINTGLVNVQNQIYYNLIPSGSPTIEKYQISSDLEVNGRNKIIFNATTINSEYSVISTGSTSFKINLKNKPESVSYTISSGISSIYYDTDSENTKGPISTVKINYSGNGYSKIPAISSVLSSNGTRAILKSASSTIGKIDITERVKDGYDYPTDKTLKPFLSVPTVAQIKNISRVDYIGIVTGGKGYNSAPRLVVIGNNKIKLSSAVNGGSVSVVSILDNSFELSVPLRIVPTNNSNGYDIDDIVVAGNDVTLELINSNNQIYPLISTGYGTTEVVFPFSVGDEIFIEKCRLNLTERDESGNLVAKDNFNSKDYNYRFFTVTGVNTGNYTVTYSMEGISNNLGEYTSDFNYGYVVNKKNMAEFEMVLIDDSKYISGESVSGFDEFGTNTFYAKVMENGWDTETNQIRLIDSVGSLRVGNILVGEKSKIRGTVGSVNQFNIPANLGVSREKVNKFSDNVGFLNDYQQRISDNDYYQKFSYSIKSTIPYDDWREPVKSLVHPAGLKEFSDLDVVGIATTGPVNIGIAKSFNMKVGVAITDISLKVNIDNLESFYNKYNFSMVTEDEQLEDGSIERIFFPDGVNLLPFILNKTNKVITVDDISDQFTGFTTSLGGEIIGITSFKLKNNGTSLFYHLFDSYDLNIVDLDRDRFFIPNHNFQSGQKLKYLTNGQASIGIATTSLVESSIKVYSSAGEVSVASTESNIIMEIGGTTGSALYENGYNVAITGPISGISSDVTPNFSFNQNAFYGFPSGYPQNSTTGVGTDARFSVFIVYNSSTGSPISTSVVLVEGGNGYSVGDVVSISGTYFGGSSPTNDLSFTVSRVANTIIPLEANNTYTNVSGVTVVGVGTNATFNISRDSTGAISSVQVVDGGYDYTLSDNITILGSDVGGVSPGDDIYLSPTVLGRNTLPDILYVEKIDDNHFSVSGLSTSEPLNLTLVGSGQHEFIYQNQNASSIISIDNIIQSPLYIRDVSVSYSGIIGLTTTIIPISSGISSITTLDILKVESEYFKIKNIIGNNLEVSRGFLGSIPDIHSSGIAVTVYRGDFNIIKDTIHFTTPPYGPTGPEGLKTRSTFNGRVFSRRFDPFAINDKNIVLDDISQNFTGIAATQFTLKSNKEDVVGIFTDTNSLLTSGSNINNNPFILINNVPQISKVDFDIDTPGQNSIKFLTGTPRAGKISRVAITTGFGYQPLVGASATVSVSVAGTINGIYLTGKGSGYRTAPIITLQSNVGSGASFSASIGAGGTITSLSIVNPGSGYTTNIKPNVVIGIPSSYSDLGLFYTNGSSGIGTGARVSVVVGNGSSIIGFKLEEPGIAYKVGDVLNVSGITTNPTVGTAFSAFTITVQEVQTDKFSGFYPGQFVKFDDIGRFFDGRKTKFTLTVTQGNQTSILTFKVDPNSSLNIENNFFIYINDVLQEPIASYTYFGSRIIFKEAPKANSKCTILYYRGSDLDVEQIDPPRTIKEGDSVKIGENILDLYDREQFERIVKKIVSSNSLDTFTYDSIGINTDPTKERPLTWKKQTKDAIISGVLYSKSRPSLQSRIVPTSKIIKNVDKTDTTIYVSNAFPLFSNVDSLSEDLRNVIVSDNKEIAPALLQPVISSATEVSGVTVNYSGVGYALTTKPKVSISSAFVLKKDSILDWKTTSGIGTTYEFRSIAYGNNIVSVGSSGLVGISTNGFTWNRQTTGYGTTVNFNSIIQYTNNQFISVGSTGTVFSLVGIGTTVFSLTKFDLIKENFILGYEVPVLTPSTYNKDFNDVTYSPSKNTIVAVGEGSGLFSSVGIGTTTLYEKISPAISNLKSICNNEFYFVAVGSGGNIIYSINALIWYIVLESNTTQTLNSVIWDGTRFIAAGNAGTILTSTNGYDSWQKLTINISENISKIRYYDGYYIILTSLGDLYYSFDLTRWLLRSTKQSNDIKDAIFVNDLGDEGRYIAVGTGATIMYSEPVFNRATAVANVTSGVVTTVTVLNPGFGYSSDNPPPALVEYDGSRVEQIKSIKVKGDFGIITRVSVGASTIDFVLKSEKYDNSTLGIGYSALDSYGVLNSGLEVGDYFVILESNAIAGHALTGISTYLGGLGAYPSSRIGTARSFIDGVYRVERVTSAAAGIVTVGCNFAKSPSGGAIQVTVPTNTNGFAGRYSWGKIYDYQNRSRETPKDFIVNTNNGLIGLSTGPDVYRTRSLYYN